MTDARLAEAYVEALTVPIGTPLRLAETYVEALTVPVGSPLRLVQTYIEALTSETIPMPPGPTAQMAIIWGGVRYAKGDPLPEFRPSQMRHMRARGYANTAAVLVVGKPFNHLGVQYASGAAMPTGLTDSQLRRLVAGRYLV